MAYLIGNGDQIIEGGKSNHWELVLSHWVLGLDHWEWGSNH